MKASFPYQKINGRYFPTIFVTVIHKTRRVGIFALIDSGASTCVFTPNVSKSLSIKPELGESFDIQGVGGEVAGYLHELWIEVAGKKFKTPVVLTKDTIAPINLLGRSSFFENFKITFNEKRKLVELS